MASGETFDVMSREVVLDTLGDEWVAPPSGGLTLVPYEGVNEPTT